MLFKRKIIVHATKCTTLVFKRKNLGSEFIVCSKCALDLGICNFYIREWCNFININFNNNPKISWTYVI